MLLLRGPYGMALTLREAMCFSPRRGRYIDSHGRQPVDHGANQRGSARRVRHFCATRYAIVTVEQCRPLPGPQLRCGDGCDPRPHGRGYQHAARCAGSGRAAVVDPPEVVGRRLHIEHDITFFQGIPLARIVVTAPNEWPARATLLTAGTYAPWAAPRRFDSSYDLPPSPRVFDR
jgi:hypothetical protein